MTLIVRTTKSKSLSRSTSVLCQAGEEGQIRRFVEVDGQGKRTLRTTEVLKEALPKLLKLERKKSKTLKTGQALLATPTNKK